MPPSSTLRLLFIGSLALWGFSSAKGAQATNNQEIYSCEGNGSDEGKQYTTHGVTFELKCSQRTDALALDRVKADTLKDCADLCALRDECQTADWGKGMCNLKKQWLPTKPGSWHTWFPIKERKPRACPGKSDRLSKPKLDAKITNTPSCPDDNGDIFATKDGAFWTLLCCTHSSDDRSELSGTISTSSSFTDCADKCSRTSGCRSFVYAAAKGRDSRGTCKLYSIGDFSTKSCKDDTHDFAYMTAPPATESDSEGIVTMACPSECPYADKREYKSRGGEVFYMNCGMRHGTRIMKEEIQSSFKACMNACSQYVPCHSVDYHTSSGKCYFSSHHGTPNTVSSGFQSAYSLGCAGACGKDFVCCENDKSSGADADSSYDSGEDGPPNPESGEGEGGPPNPESGKEESGPPNPESGKEESGPPNPESSGGESGPPAIKLKDPACGYDNEQNLKQHGRNWKVFCGGFVDGTVIFSNPVASPKDCVEKCASDPRCTHANWTKAPRADGSRMCWTKEKGHSRIPTKLNDSYASLLLQS